MEDKALTELATHRRTFNGCEYCGAECRCHAPVQIRLTSLGPCDEFNIIVQLDCVEPLPDADCSLETPDQESCPTCRTLESFRQLPKQVRVNRPLFEEGSISTDLREGNFGVLIGQDLH